MGLFEFLKSSSGLGNLNDCDRLFLIAKGGIVEIKRGYKDLTNSGKLEVIIFNSLLVLRIYRKNHPENAARMDSDFVKKLLMQAKTFQTGLNPTQLISFIKSRAGFYSNELDDLGSSEAYMPGKIYSAFYLKPLASNPESCRDLGEILKFQFGLGNMIEWVQDHADSI